MLRKWQFYFGANEYVEMTEGIDSSMLASLGDRRRRRFLTGICLAMVLFVAAVWTASTPRAVQWLARTAPPLARLLDPEMGGPEESGIRQFMEEFTLAGTYDDPTGHDLWRIFDTDNTQDLDALPQKTSLQRAYAQWLKDGKAVGGGIGIRYIPV